MLEVEIKLCLGENDTNFRQLLAEQGYLRTSLVYERNTLYDTPDGKLEAAGELFRLRTTGTARYNCTTTKELTFKGKNISNEKLMREECNVLLEKGDIARIITALGYIEKWHYARWRTAYKHKNINLGGVVYIDSFDKPWGIKDSYAEFEGWDVWIDDLAAKLGYTKDQYITKSYYELFK